MRESEGVSRRDFVRGISAGVLTSALTLVDTAAIAADELGDEQLVASFDCSKDYPPEKYFALREARVAETPIGRYREADATPQSRFGYRFAVENVGRPHLAVVRYPDDKRRFMSVTDGTCYDLSTGVFTGPGLPLSGGMLEIRQVFWPRWKDCSIVFTTLAGGEPAAVATLAIYELTDLPLQPVPGDPGDGSRRELGIQYEDPCGSAASEGAATFDEWLARMIAYARHSGQKSLAYPIIWYHGPVFPSQREPAHYLDIAVSPKDRTQYVRWTSHPADWVTRLLKRFWEEKLEFRGTVTLMRLGSLMERMNTDLKSIQAGAETINNMLFNDEVQAGTNDWTREYNVGNFSKLVEYREKTGTGIGGKTDDQFPWAYGEKKAGLDRWGPIFNPLHPVVQAAVLGIVQEIADRYGSFAAFKGLSFHMMFPSAILWFGSLKAGYDDYTVGLFAKETGIAVPVDEKAPDRFSQRYAFLTAKHREEWIAWRCRKVRDLVCAIRDILVRARGDLRVTLNIYPNLVLRREAGLDATLLSGEHAIEFDCHWDTRGRALEDEGANAARIFRGAYIFNNWVENWGKNKWFACAPTDPQAREMAVILGQPADGICRMNSEYEKDGFWWDSQLRIPQVFPSGIHYMEHYAHAVAELDACRIMRGGLYLDKAHTALIQQFALAYRALPAEKFQTVGEKTDPVTMRTKVHEGRCYLYLVNRDYFSVPVEIQIDVSCRVIDLATSEVIEAPAQWSLTLRPYELRSFALPAEAKVRGFTAVPPDEIVIRLKNEGEQLLERISKAHAAGKALSPQIDQLAAGIRRALERGGTAALRRIISSDAAKKFHEL
ncbi:MAG TPA: hypothetical protein VK961_03875 [Chthoniobacter sp.]|nr:hypothetical protein [Chthoniobacter sp.]